MYIFLDLRQNTEIARETNWAKHDIEMHIEIYFDLMVLCLQAAIWILQIFLEIHEVATLHWTVIETLPDLGDPVRLLGYHFACDHNR